MFREYSIVAEIASATLGQDLGPSSRENQLQIRHFYSYWGSHVCTCGASVRVGALLPLQGMLSLGVWRKGLG